MTSSHQGHQIADAFRCRLSLREVHLSSGLFVFIRVHWWFVFIKRSAVCPRMIRTAGGAARGQTGVSQRVHVGFLRSHPPDTPHGTAGTALPGSAGVPPAPCPFGRR